MSVPRELKLVLRRLGYVTPHISERRFLRREQMAARSAREAQIKAALEKGLKQLREAERASPKQSPAKKRVAEIHR